MTHQTTPAVNQTASEALWNWLFARLPAAVLETFSPDQRQALHDAVEGNSSSGPPVNIRFNMPLLAWRFYLTIVGGEEKRGTERRVRDRHRYPLRSVANIFFFIGLAVIFYIIVILALAFHTAIVEI